MRKASKDKRPMLVPNPKGKLFDQVREVMRFHHYSLRTAGGSRRLKVES